MLLLDEKEAISMIGTNISVPDDLQAFVDQQAQRGYSNASEFVRELIRNARRQAAKERWGKQEKGSTRS
jgi:Arc/MetJ-type ribon-helix-helix transcriptional regulator